MTRALGLARAAARRGEVPVGALVVRGGEILGEGSNRTIGSKDPSAHAEVVALRRAARRRGNHRLTGATLYVTLEPCLMCLGAMVQARVKRLVYAAEEPKSGAVALLSSPEVRLRSNHRFEVTGGVLASDSAMILKEFFGARRGGAGGPAGSGGQAKRSRRRAD